MYPTFYVAGLLDAAGCFEKTDDGVKLSVCHPNKKVLSGLKGYFWEGHIDKIGEFYRYEVVGSAITLEGILSEMKVQQEGLQKLLDVEPAPSRAPANRANYCWLSGFLDAYSVTFSFETTDGLSVKAHCPVTPEMGEVLKDTWGGYLTTLSSGLTNWVLPLDESCVKGLLAYSVYNHEKLSLFLDCIRHGDLNKVSAATAKDKLANFTELSKYIDNSTRNYQQWTRTTAKYPRESAISYLTLGLASESGEVAGVVKKVIRDNNGIVDEERRAKILDEMSDVAWYLTRLCDELDFSLTDLLTLNMSKLEDRLSRGKIKGSGDDR